VRSAIERFLALHPEFAADVGREPWRVTANPMGWLKRVQ
jgi:hypothetical protein